MEKVILADGSEQEVPTNEELTAFQSAAQEAVTLKTSVETLTKEKEALLNDPANRNWKQIREVNDKLKDALKAQGKTVSEDGIISEVVKAPTLDEITDKTRLIVAEENIKLKKNEALARFPEEKRKVVEHYLGKLTAGEQVTPDNLDKFINDAAFLADPQAAAAKPRFAGGGQPPLLKPQDGNSFAETEAGKSIADEVFGDNSFTKKK